MGHGWELCPMSEPGREPLLGSTKLVPATAPDGTEPSGSHVRHIRRSFTGGSAANLRLHRFRKHWPIGVLPPVALLARGELDDLSYAGNAIIALPYEDRDALRAAADFLETSKPVVRNTGKQKAQWLKPCARPLSAR
jgi:hypothetical protein